MAQITLVRPVTMETTKDSTYIIHFGSWILESDKKVPLVGSEGEFPVIGWEDMKITSV